MTVSVISRFASPGCLKTYRNVLSSSATRARLKCRCFGVASAIFASTAVKFALRLNTTAAAFVSALAIPAAATTLPLWKGVIR
jgi:hypothetical protein